MVQILFTTVENLDWGNQEFTETLEDKETCYKCECYKPWQYKNKNITKENREEKSGTISTCANFLNFQRKESIGTFKNQAKNRGHLFIQASKTATTTEYTTRAKKYQEVKRNQFM